MIRVGYDVSFIVLKPGGSEAVTGVGRAIERVLGNLMRVPDLDVRAVGCFEGDWNPVSTSLRAKRWATRRYCDSSASIDAYDVRLGFLSWLAPLQLKLESIAPNTVLRFPVEFCLKLLRRVIQCDAKLVLKPANIDVFCSTFLPPPIWIHRSIPRLIFIYDVYPLRYPEHCSSSVIGSLQATIDGLDFDRDIVVAISDFSKADFCELTGFPPERVIVAHLAADDLFCPVSDHVTTSRIRTEYKLGDAPYLLSVANPQPRKNLLALIEAFDRVAHKLLDWRGNLVLAGNASVGWGTGAIKNKLRSLGELAERILWIGPVREADLPAVYSEAMAFVFPSLFEGFGLPVLEAMQCGTPVICSNTTSLPEVVGDSALQVDPTNVDALARAICEFIGCDTLRKRYGAMGLSRSKNFSWESTAQQVATAIRMAASN